MNPQLLMAAAIASGTPLLLAALGELVTDGPACSTSGSRERC